MNVYFIIIINYKKKMLRLHCSERCKRPSVEDYHVTGSSNPAMMQGVDVIDCGYISANLNALGHGGGN